MVRRLTRVARSGALGLVLALSACGSDGGTGPDGSTVQSIAIASPTSAVVEQQATTLTATVTIRGTPRAAQAGEVSWALVTPSDGQITSSGQFTPSRPGNIGVRLQATANPAVTVTRLITVDSAAFVSISLVPLIGVAPGDTVRPQVIGVDAVGRDRVPREVQFQSLNGSLEALPDGRSFRAVTAGQGQVQATVGSLTAFVAVPVASPYVRLAVTLLDPVIDWAQGARVRIEGITPTGAAVDVTTAAAVSQVVATPAGLVETVVGYIPGRLRTVVPPFTATARRDVGATARVAFQYRGVADTLVIPMRYRRPTAVTWTLAAPGTRVMEIGESFPLGETVLRDSSGAVVAIADARGTLDSVGTSNAVLVSVSPARVVTALASGSASVLQDYREPARSQVGANISVSVAFPPPPAPDLTPIGTGYIKVVAFHGLRPNERAAVAAAVARVEAVIAGSTAAPQSINLPASTCLTGAPAVNETVTGVLVQLAVRAVDGAGGVLGAAGPCVYRSAPDRRAALGLMYLDEVDLPTLAAAGHLADVVAHELMHVLGIGTLWTVAGYNFVPSPLGSDPTYSGPAGNTAFGMLGGIGQVPVENVGLSGSIGSHWRESVLRSELMTSLSGGTNRLSRLTIGALADLGYTVDYSRAEPYTLGQLIAGLNGGSPGEEQALHDEVLPPKFMVDGLGRVVPYRP
jgi:hypothetical protein